MNINSEEYTTKLKQVTEGSITEQEWMDYCKELLNQIMDDAKEVFIRMKEND